MEEKTFSDTDANVSVSQPTINTVFKAKPPSASARAASITTSGACFVYKDLRPYSVVENGFCRMLHTLEPSYDIPCRKYFPNPLYAEMKAKVENTLQSYARCVEVIPKAALQWKLIGKDPAFVTD